MRLDMVAETFRPAEQPDQNILMWLMPGLDTEFINTEQVIQFTLSQLKLSVCNVMQT